MSAPDTWYLIVPAEAGIPAWILAETCDEPWLKDMTGTWGTALILKRDEALLDPDFHSAIEAWDRKDLRAYAAFRSMEEIDAETPVALELEMERRVGPPPVAEPHPPGRWESDEDTLLADAWRAITRQIDDWYERGEQLRPGLGKLMARQIALNAKSYAVGPRERMI